MKERIERAMSAAITAKDYEKERLALCDFGAAFLDAIYISTEGQLWNGSVQIDCQLNSSKDLGIKDGTCFTLTPIPSDRDINLAVVSFSQGLQNPKIGAQVVIESKFKPNGGHQIATMRYFCNPNLGFTKETTFTLMGVVAILANEKK